VTSLVGLAVTVHDSGANYVPGLRRLSSALRTTFCNVGAVVTSATAPDTRRFLVEDLNAAVLDVEPNDMIGLHRRESVRLALAPGAQSVLYSDLDHILRWLENEPNEVAQCLASFDTDVRVIGRTVEAMRECPRRLRDTEAIINHAYELATGRPYDLMFATRLMTANAASYVVTNSTEVTAGNDVDWPMLLERAGFAIDYFAARGLTYRIAEGFDGPPDELDADPAAWVYRVEMMANHAAALKRYL